MANTKKENRKNRHKRVRAKIIGTSKCPRFSVFRSNKHMFLQLIDDVKGETLVSSGDFAKDSKKKIPGTERAKEAGKQLAKLAKEKKISKVVFDRGGYKYHGRVMAAAEGAREEGLKF